MKTQLSKLKTIRLALGYMDDLATGIVGFVKKLAILRVYMKWMY